jgi:hypothetical protein
MRSMRRNPYLGADQDIALVIQDQTGAKTLRARISPKATVDTILPAIITRLALPITAPDGSPMSYSLDWMEGGLRLAEGQTLEDIGIQTGHRLIVYPEIVAGELGCATEGYDLGAAEPGVYVLTILDQTGAKSIRARISGDMTPERILPNIITNLRLPVTAPDGSPMSYSLDWKEGGVRLMEGQSLEDIGIQTGHHLIIYPEIVAGRHRRRSW